MLEASSSQPVSSALNTGAVPESPYINGFEIRASAGREALMKALHAAVDYRGDVTLQLRNGDPIVGYIFTLNGNAVDLYPKDSDQKQHVLIETISKLSFSGRDTAA